MPENTVNIPLLRKAVEWAEAEAIKPPELCEWDQRVWMVHPDEFEAEYGASKKAPECGTCFCVAGYIAFQEGAVSANYDIEFIAADALGLPYDHVKSLFECDNTIEDVRRIAEEIAGERL